MMMGRFRRKCRGFYFLAVVAIYLINSNSAAESEFNLSITQNTSSWYEASVQCRLIGIDLNTRMDLETVLSTFNGVTSNAEFPSWIGAHVQYSTWLNFKSCKYGTNSSAGFPIHSDKEPVISCLERCSDTFYLSNGICFCHNEVTVNLITWLCKPTKCSNNDEDLCGTNHTHRLEGQEHLCLCEYRILSEPLTIVDNSKIGNCITLVGPQPSLQNEECDSEFPYICQPLMGFTPEKNHDEITWQNAAIDCYYDNKILSQGLSTRFTTPVWVSFFRKATFWWGYPNVTNEDNDCLAISRDNNGTLKPYIEKCNSSLPSICENQFLISEYTVTYISKIQSTTVFKSEEGNSILYIAIGSVCGVTALLILFLWICVRKNKTRQNISTISQANEVDDNRIVVIADHPYSEIENIEHESTYHEIEDTMVKLSSCTPVLYNTENGEGVSQSTDRSNYDVVCRQGQYSKLQDQRSRAGDSIVNDDYDTMMNLTDEYSQLKTCNPVTINVNSEYDTVTNTK